MQARRAVAALLIATLLPLTGGSSVEAQHVPGFALASSHSPHPEPTPTATPTAIQTATPTPTPSAITVPLPVPVISISPVPVPIPIPVPVPVPTQTIIIIPTPIPGPVRTIISPSPVPGPVRTVFVERVRVVPGPERTTVKEVPGPERQVLVPVPGPTHTVISEKLTPRQEREVEERIKEVRFKYGLLGILIGFLSAIAAMAAVAIYFFRKGEIKGLRLLRDTI